MIPVEARLKSQGYQNLRRFDIQTRLMDSSLDVIYTSAQTLSTNIVNEPSNLAPTANVPPTNMYATIVFPPSPFDGSTVPGLTNVFYPQYVSITNGTITLQPGSYQIQVSGLTAQGNITYSIDFNQGSNVLSTVTYDNGNIKSSSFQAPLTDVVLFPAVGTVLIDYILNIATESSFSLSIAASGITESNINIYNYVQ